MKNQFLAVLFVVFAATLSFAGDGKVTGGISQEVRSGYLGSGGFLFSNRAVSQTDVFFDYNGLRAEAWLSTNFNGAFRENDGAEMDWIIAYNRDVTIADHTVNIDAGVAYFDCPTLFSGTSGDTVELFVESQFKNSSAFTPFVRWESDFATDGGNANKFFGGTRHTLKISDALSLNSKVAAVFDLGDGSSDSGTLLLIESGLGWVYNDQLTINPLFVKATARLIDATDRNDSEAIVGAGVNFTF